jgi:hypothetical protein
MVLRMARPSYRSGSSKAQFRKRIPTGVLSQARGKKVAFCLPGGGESEPEVTFDITLASKIRFSLRTENEALAKRRHAAASTQLEDALAAVRNGNKWLNHKERVAFGGLVYDEFVMGFGDFPGAPEIWPLAREVHEKASLTPERAEAWFGPHVDQVALRKGFVPDRDTPPPAALIKEASRAMIEAAEQLRRNAEGDFRPDPNRERFPDWKPVSGATTSAPSVSIAAILNGWAQEAAALGRTKKTLKEYRSLVTRFAEKFDLKKQSAVRPRLRRGAPSLPLPQRRFAS